MKKTEVKKLRLHRETLRNLREFALAEVVGGDSLANSCDPGSSVRRCPQTCLC